MQAMSIGVCAVRSAVTAGTFRVPCWHPRMRCSADRRMRQLIRTSCATCLRAFRSIDRNPHAVDGVQYRGTAISRGSSSTAEVAVARFRSECDAHSARALRCGSRAASSSRWRFRSWSSPCRGGLRQCERKSQSIGDCAVGQSVADQQRDLTFPIGQRQRRGASRSAGVSAPPHCSASVSARPASQRRSAPFLAAIGDGRLRGRVDRRHPIAHLLETFDTKANSAASSSRTAAAKRAASPTRGPSTIPSSSRNRGAPDGRRTGWRSAGTAPRRRICRLLRQFRPPTTRWRSPH